MTWQPIETAPKTGRFLVWGGVIHGEGCRYKDPNKTVAMVEAGGRGVLFVADSEYYSPSLVGATHWMPLPEPPA